MAESKATEQAAESLNFKHAAYIKKLSENYRNRLGWDTAVAEEAARIASDVLRTEYGGSSQYIAARMIDREEIRKQYDGGSAADLARRFGISSRTVRRILEAKN